MNSFSEVKAFFDEHCDVMDRSTFFDDLSVDEINALKYEISGWTGKELADAKDVLSGYYGLGVPDEFLKGVLVDDLELAFEVFTGGVGDTLERGWLCDSILKKMQVRSWPLNKEGDDVSNKFFLDLKVAAPKFGVVFVAD